MMLKKTSDQKVCHSRTQGVTMTNFANLTLLRLPESGYQIIIFKRKYVKKLKKKQNK